MKRFLKAFVAWLDRKFPDKLFVTKEAYEDLYNRSIGYQKLIDYLTGEVSHLVVTSEKLTKELEELNKTLAPYSPERIKTIESELNKFNVSLGFGPSLALHGQQQRQPFQR